MKICWILIIRIFHWILGINLKPNQTFDLIFRLNHGHNNQSPPLWLAFTVMPRLWHDPPPQFYLELKHTSPLVVTRYCNTVDGRQQAPSWHFVILETGLAGTRLLTTPLNDTNRFCHLTPRPVTARSKTAESLLQQNVWRCYRCSLEEESHVPRLSSGQQWPECVDCALNTAVIDGRVRCCFPRFTSWSCLWFSMAHASLCGRELGPTV